MASPGEVRRGPDGALIEVVSITETGLMLSDAPGRMFGPVPAAAVDLHYPTMLGVTLDPGLFKLIAHLDKFWARLGIPEAARDFGTVRARVSSFFYLAVPDQPLPDPYPVAMTPLEEEAMAMLGDDLGAQPGMAHGLFAAARAGVAKLYGLVEPPLPSWAEVGGYVLHHGQDVHGHHLRVLSVADGVVKLRRDAPYPVDTLEVPIGLLYNGLIAPRNDGMPVGLPCESCGRPQGILGCCWAPCERCTPYLHDAVVDAEGNKGGGVV